MKVARPAVQELWQRICLVLIEAGEPLPTDLICARVHERHVKVYPRLRQLEQKGIVAAERSPLLRSVFWTYIGHDVARQAKPVDLDGPAR